VSALPWIAAGLFALAAISVVTRNRRRAQTLERLKRDWGQLVDRRRDMPAIAKLFRAELEAGTTNGLDDRTWTDLNLDDVFAVLDRTESVVGQQRLYARLRGSAAGASLDAFEALVTKFSDDPDTREAAQLALTALRDPSGYDVIDLTRPDALDTQAWHLVFPVLGVSMLAALVLVPIWPALIFLLAVGALAGSVLRGTIARDLQIVTGAFRQVGPLISAAATIGTLPLPSTELTGRLRGHVSALAGLRRIAGWVSRDRSGAAAGDLGGLVIEYLNLLFFLDANALFFGGRELRAHAADLRGLVGAVGEVDAALSVASYRAGTSGWTRPRFGAATDRLHLAEIRHPLLPDAVPNSVTLGPPDGLLITGSNMSGKSTFLRTVGVTIVMAQTIHTCLAETYEGPLVVVRSCIGRADDPASGKSYYLVEVESVLDLVRAARTPQRHIMLFDELFRGTNAIERIAAGAAVLESLLTTDSETSTRDNGPRNIVIAATHDLELVDLLARRYAPYHFTDSLDADGLIFDYRLRQGASTTRNAIALLELRGAPSDLVARALAHAQDLGHNARVLSRS
jgi:hypothetical protein